MRVLLSFFGFAALNLPTCHWLGCSRALKPRRSASSAALVDEPGSDSQKPDCELRLSLIFERSVRDTLSRARDQQRHKRRQMAPSAALREEPGSGSLARGRPSVHPTRSHLVGLRPASEVEHCEPKSLRRSDTFTSAVDDWLWSSRALSLSQSDASSVSCVRMLTSRTRREETRKDTSLCQCHPRW